MNDIRHASDFVDLCALFGYYAEEHVVQTADGYLLGLHRLGWKKGQEGSRVNGGADSIRKRVVYLHHGMFTLLLLSLQSSLRIDQMANYLLRLGLLMNSEVWVCLTEKERCLPFLLVDHGFDVWVSAASLFTLLLTSSFRHHNNNTTTKHKHKQRLTHLVIVWKQSWQQVLEEGHSLLAYVDRLLGLLHG